MISVWWETSVSDFGRYFSTQGVAVVVVAEAIDTKFTTRSLLNSRDTQCKPSVLLLCRE